MSLLNRPSDGLPSVLAVLFKFLVQQGPTSVERLVSLCSPSPAVKDSFVEKTLNTWLDLGLFERLSGEKVGLHSDLRRTERTLDVLPRIVRRLVLAERNNTNFWDAEGSQAADFTRALAWLMAQDVYFCEFGAWDDVHRLLQRQDTEAVLRNSTRWDGLKDWAPFLGFAWTSGRKPVQLIIDPTPAIRDVIPTVYGTKKTLAAGDFVTALAGELPIVDGGSYRQEVETLLRKRTGPDAWAPPPGGQLSTSLSRALLRLEGENIIKFEARDDAPQTARLTGREGRVLETVTHFTWTAAAAK